MSDTGKIEEGRKERAIGRLEIYFGVTRDKQRVTTENGVHNIRGYKNLCLVSHANDEEYGEED
jgi:hypothetical protein